MKEREREKLNGIGEGEGRKTCIGKTWEEEREREQARTSLPYSISLSPSLFLSRFSVNTHPSISKKQSGRGRSLQLPLRKKDHFLFLFEANNAGSKGPDSEPLMISKH